FVHEKEPPATTLSLPHLRRSGRADGQRRRWWIADLFERHARTVSRRAQPAVSGHGELARTGEADARRLRGGAQLDDDKARRAQWRSHEVPRCEPAASALAGEQLRSSAAREGTFPPGRIDKPDATGGREKQDC